MAAKTISENVVNRCCPSMTLKTLSSFSCKTKIGNVARKTLFTTIFIGDELNAYKVFETLNARGVRLSSADLLKNLFSIVR
jgi:uncharacterized protein with ParB-like and HNH nuclease domain